MRHYERSTRPLLCETSGPYFISYPRVLRIKTKYVPKKLGPIKTRLSEFSSTVTRHLKRACTSWSRNLSWSPVLPVFVQTPWLKDCEVCSTESILQAAANVRQESFMSYHSRCCSPFVSGCVRNIKGTPAIELYDWQLRSELHIRDNETPWLCRAVYWFAYQRFVYI